MVNTVVACTSTRVDTVRDGSNDIDLAGYSKQ